MNMQVSERMADGCGHSAVRAMTVIPLAAGSAATRATDLYSRSESEMSEDLTKVTMFKFFLRADCLLSAIVEAPNEEVAREQFKVGQYGGYTIEDIGEDELVRIEMIEQFITSIRPLR